MSTLGTKEGVFKRLLALLLITTLPALVDAQFIFTTNNGAITITGYSDLSATIIIPDKINDLPVNAIGDYALLCAINIVVPGSVTNLGYDAFNRCYSLNAVYFAGNAPAANPGAFGGNPTATAYYWPGTTGWSDSLAGRPTAPFPFIFTITNGTVTITDYAGPDGAVVIPDTIAGLPVTRIKDFAFAFSGLTDITIPKSVSSIGDNAFLACADLVSIAIPGAVTNIGIGAFALCSSLASVTIGSSVTTLGNGAFTHCTNLTAVYFMSGAPQEASSVFDSDFKTTVYYFQGTSGWGASFDGRPTAVFPFTYTTNLSGATITGYIGSGGAVAIPSSLNNLPVVGIGRGAFAYRGVSAVTIPDSVVNIGENAFLVSSLTDVMIGSGVTNIGEAAFLDCFNLTHINVNPSNLAYSSLEGVLFNGCQTTLIQYPPGTAEASYTVPYGVNYIGMSAFENCNVTNVALPWGITCIGDSAFRGCPLDCITLPDSVTRIGRWSFYNCFNLARITLGDGVTNIGDGAFAYCGSLTNITLPKSVTAIGTEAFFASGLASVSIGSGVASIGDDAFADCSSLISIYAFGNAPVADATVFDSDNKATVYFLPGTTGWAGAFGGRPTAPFPFAFTITNGAAAIMGYLGSGGPVTLPDSINDVPVTSIGNSAFGNGKLTSVTIPDCVTNIGTNAFSSSALTSVSLGRGVNTIADGAFSTCYYLTSVTIPDSVTSLGDNAFRYCTSLSSLRLSDHITHLGYMTFYACYYLGSVKIPDSVTNIGNFAFCSSGLNTIQFGAGLTRIEEYAFANCGLTSVSVPGNVHTIAPNAFNPCPYLAALTISNGVVEIGDTAFAYCNLSSVTIPPSVTNIGSAPFYACSQLNTISVDPGNPAYSSLNGVLFNRGQTTLVEFPLGAVGSSYSIPATVANIGPYAFTFTSLASITLPDSLTNIQDGAFAACGNLTNVVIPNRVLAIGGAAFLNCSSLRDVAFGNSLFSIGDNAFNGCPLKSVAIPAGVTNIGVGAFGACHNLRNVTFGGGVASIGDYAFADCNLTSFTVPDGLRRIGEHFLSGCPLTNVTISATVNSIGDYAFANCPLASITIPASVNSIGEAAFAGCTSLTKVYFLGDAPPDGLYTTGMFNGGQTTVYYLAGTAGWGNFFGGSRSVPWMLPYPLILGGTSSFGALSNRFGFTVSWATNLSVVVEACTSLSAAPIWERLQTNTFNKGSFYFSDPGWTNHASRFYRIRSL